MTRSCALPAIGGCLEFEFYVERLVGAVRIMADAARTTPGRTLRFVRDMQPVQVLTTDGIALPTIVAKTAFAILRNHGCVMAIHAKVFNSFFQDEPERCSVWIMAV